MERSKAILLCQRNKERRIIYALMIKKMAKDPVCGIGGISEFIKIMEQEKKN